MHKPMSALPPKADMSVASSLCVSRLDAQSARQWRGRPCHSSRAGQAACNPIMFLRAHQNQQIRMAVLYEDLGRRAYAPMALAAIAEALADHSAPDLA